MQGHHNGEAILLVEVAQGLHDIAGRFRVQRGDGLVSQQHAGTLHQSTGDGGTLLLPKYAHTGVTFAAAVRPFAPDWRWKTDEA